MNRISTLTVVLAFACSAPTLFAQRGGGRGGAPPAAASGPRPVDITASRSFDMAAVERGGKIYAAQCASCHGENARGGKSTKTDVDLLRSDIVLLDHGGREFSEFMKYGRPEKNMPKFDLAANDAVDLATWMHYTVSLAALWGQYQKHNVFSGDPKAGEAFFNGPVGKCSTCHSVTGDLKGVGAKNNGDAPTLQSTILNGGGRFGGRGGGGGGGRGGRGGGGGGGNVTATVTLKSGEKFTGAPGLINDFVVEIRTADGDDKTWLRDGDWPKVTLVNKLQAHIDLVPKYTDDDIHNLAAYLKDK